MFVEIILIFLFFNVLIYGFDFYGMKITNVYPPPFLGASHVCVTFFDSHRGQAHEFKMK